MQILLNRSKFIILALLSCALAMVLYVEYVDVATLESTLVPASVNVDSAIQSDQSIWNSMSNELTLDHKTSSAQVQAEIHKLLEDPSKFTQILQAAAPYIYFIHKQTQAHGLPAELALIPVIESEFNPNDHSKAGATGLWQLMPETAHELGIKVKSNYDGRRNVVSSTHAALAYFNDLGNDFKGNWYLAIAAYNCGQGRIMSAERRTDSSSFWSLPLPKETKLYVPRLLAVAAIVKNPQKYGIVLPKVSNQPYFTTLHLKKAVNLAQIAKTSGISIQTLTALNPDYKKGAPLPQKSGAYTLLVPVNKASAVESQLSGQIVNVSLA